MKECKGECVKEWRIEGLKSKERLWTQVVSRTPEGDVEEGHEQDRTYQVTTLIIISLTFVRNCNLSFTFFLNFSPTIKLKSIYKKLNKSVKLFELRIF